MTVSLEAHKRWIESHSRVRQESHYAQQAIIEVGRKARMVLDHPGWQTYLDHLGAIIENVERERSQIARDITEGDTLGEMLAQMKMRLKALDGQLKGLNQAADLIPEMIKRAQDIIDKRIVNDPGD